MQYLIKFYSKFREMFCWNLQNNSTICIKKGMARKFLNKNSHDGLKKKTVRGLPIQTSSLVEFWSCVNEYLVVSVWKQEKGSRIENPETTHIDHSVNMAILCYSWFEPGCDSSWLKALKIYHSTVNMAIMGKE